MKIVNLSEVAKIYNGNSINERFKAQHFSDVIGGTPYVATKDISYTFEVNYENGISIPKENSKDFKIARKGSVLLCAEGGSSGRKLALLDRNVFFVNKLFCFEAFEELNSKYLFYYLQAPRFQSLFKESITGLIGGVSLEKVRNLPIGIPSLEKQNIVVEKLDRCFAEIELLEANLAVIENYCEELMYSVQQDLFVSNFKQVRIGDICKLMTGGTPSRTRPEYFVDGTIKWLVSGDIHKREIYDCEGRITLEAMKSSNTKILPLNSVMIALNGQGKTRGTVALLKTEATCNQSLVSISPIDESELLSEFLFYNLKMRYQEIRRMTGDDGNERRGLNMILIRNIQIPLPFLEKQREIVEKLDSAFAEIESLKERIKTEMDFSSSLRKSLLSSAFIQENEVA